VDTNAFLRFASEYYHRPVEFAQHVLNVELSPQQRELVNDIVDTKIRQISVRSGHGTGKSHALAVAAVHFACTRHPWTIAVTAPTSSQLWDALWPRIQSFFAKLPPALRPLFNVTSDRVELVGDKDCFITARTSTKEKPESIAGKHSENMLILVDEASGVPDEVFETAQGSMSDKNATTVLTSNPTRTSGLFYDSHHRLTKLWKTHHWSSTESPFVNQAFIDTVRETYGDGSNQWRVRVLGEFPEADDDTLISRSIVEAAMARSNPKNDNYLELDEDGKRVWCIDPARFGADRTGFCGWLGNSVAWLKKKSGMDIMGVTGWIKHEWDETPTGERPEEIIVDVIGLGGGVVDRLNELGLPVTGVNVAEAALAFSDGYRLRDQLWLDMKRWLEAGLGSLPKNNALLDDLITPGYTFMSNGKLKVESKQEIKRRGGNSPDLADTVMLRFASDPAIVMTGRQGNQWGRSMKRNVVGYG
jgi:hypothetical protein